MCYRFFICVKEGTQFEKLLNIGEVKSGSPYVLPQSVKNGSAPFPAHKCNYSVA